MAAAVVKVFDTQTLMVPVELTTRCQSVALDMGGSVLKVVYKTKGDLDDAISKCNKYGRLHVVSFERSELERGLDYVRQHAYLPSDGDQLPTMYATGAGCHEFVKHICQKLNVRIEIRAEFDCFVKSFVYMAARLPRTQLLEPFLDDAVDEPLAYVTRHVTTLVECQAKEATRGIYKLTETLNQQLRMSTGRPAALETALVGSMSVDVPLTDEEPDLFPCVLVTCGSGTAVMKIEKDGTFRIVDVSSRGGRSFFGIGKLLSGCKTFDELIDLASKGNSRNIDVYSDELFNSRDAAEDDSSSVYDMLNKSIPSLMYSFGKATVDEQTSAWSRRL
jgi:pantothenate kinase